MKQVYFLMYNKTVTELAYNRVVCSHVFPTYYYYYFVLVLVLSVVIKMPSFRAGGAQIDLPRQYLSAPQLRLSSFSLLQAPALTWSSSLLSLSCPQV